MIDEQVFQSWPGGINNRAEKNRVPEGFVRDMLNLDPGTLLRSRVGYERVAVGTNCRAVTALGRKIVYADGAALMEYDVATDATRQLATIAGVGPVGHAVHNNELFLSTVNETLRYDGQTLRLWGVPTVTQQPSVSVSNQRSGRRLYAMTLVNEYGEEGGTVSAASVPDGSYVFAVPPLPAGHTARIYVSALNGKTLYLQLENLLEGSVFLGNPGTDTATLATMHMSSPHTGGFIASKGGSIVIGAGEVLTVTEPMWPHLISPMRRFIAYPAEIGMVLSGLHGIYVSSDKCYQVTDIETDSPAQRTVMDYPAIFGTGTILPNGQAAWVTRYGMAVESSDAREGVTEPNRANFAVGEHGKGASAVVEDDGDQRLVAAMKKSEGQGSLAAADYFEAEVIRP